MKIVSPFIMLSFSLRKTNLQREHNIVAVPALHKKQQLNVIQPTHWSSNTEQLINRLRNKM